MQRSRPRYSPEFRPQMVAFLTCGQASCAVVRSGRTPESLSGEFEPSAQSIRNWVEQSDRNAGLRPYGLTSAERQELRQLRRDNRRLRVERDILAKAAPWFARETDSVPKRSSHS